MRKPDYTTYVVMRERIHGRTQQPYVVPEGATRHASREEAEAEAERRRADGERVTIVTESTWVASDRQDHASTYAADIIGERNRLALSQAQLAERLGVDVMTVSRWERGERQPPPYLLLALAHLSCRARRSRT